MYSKYMNSCWGSAGKRPDLKNKEAGSTLERLQSAPNMPPLQRQKPMTHVPAPEQSFGQASNTDPASIRSLQSLPCTMGY